ncbi:MAG: enoyl-CoA hydratase/isomerase family protein [Candidatus Eremiobacteraeota bacterium]|nr:enoyl-CoA hydratase/isomerase family protein [Candidatus Eremiobacteraeota bacterium]MCW5869273.1 enoyl-CoA hydratase/isomerase family protein [Candidatus Eremiobacteraeota bacterium]
MLKTEPILLEELTTAGKRRFGVATLNAPDSLNALSLEMVRSLRPALEKWAQDPDIAGVFLQGAGEKAFCAGGDIRELYASLRETSNPPGEYARSFFAEEYQLDYLIHAYPKPFLCWGHGIVMGGGLGLMAGASHRVVTSKSRIAMPEVTIGLYPDVGGSWILRRMPGRVGLFLGLTAAPLNAADALFCGLGDFHIEAERRQEVLSALAATVWSGEERSDRAELSRLLARYTTSQGPVSKVREHFDLLNRLMAGEDLREIAARIAAMESEDAWLAGARSAFVKGSPTSAALAFELWQRVPHLSLAAVFRLEYLVSLGCCAHSDFIEGVRALLIEKDRKPQWNPPSLLEVTASLVESHFETRFQGPHPLQGLGS